MADEPLDEVFDTSHYASSVWEKLIRSVQLAGRYYFTAVPKYVRDRRRARLPGSDLAVLTNPLRELVRRNYHSLPLPPGYPGVLMELRDAGVRMTMPRVRLEGLLGMWWSTRDTPGEVIECGAFEGATGLTLATLAKRHSVPCRVILADTFRGIPAAGRHDSLRAGGEYSGNGLPDRIKEQATRLGVADRMQLLEGLFADTLPTLLVEEPELRFSFVHVDANVYEGTRDACTFTLPRVSPNGAMVFDDYNGVLDLGARLAIQEALAGTGLEPAALASSSAWIRK